MKYREYAYTGRWADGSLHTDTVYVAHPDPKPGMPRNDDRIVWDVRDYPSKHLASALDRKWAAQWLRIRRLAGRPMTGEMVPGPEATNIYRNELRIHEGGLSRRNVDHVPNMPVSAYTEAGKIVLHGEGMEDGRYGSYRYGETVEGTSYTETRLSVDGYDDFHQNQECDEHGDDPRCGACGEVLWDQSPNCPDTVWPDCEQCMEVYKCQSGNCDCISKLEQCGICDRDLGDGDTVWLCLDGGEVYCPEHAVVDERPDELFKRVGGVRGAMLPEFAWPGGYTIVYYTRDGDQVCAECASQVDISDPAVTADADEEMNCACEHAQSLHRSTLIGGAHEADPETADVGPCDHDEQKPATNERSNNEAYKHCGCVSYYPPLCDDCGEPIDPDLRAWWANLRGGKVMA